MNNKKKIVIYAHYYIPDTASTGQLLKELAEGLLEQFEVIVVCVVPSYLGTVAKEYQDKRFYYEKINGVSVIRIRVPEFEKTNKISRIKNILHYFLGARAVSRKLNDIDYVLSISQPPVLGGLLGVYGKKKLKAKFIYNIQDFNPEQIIAVKYSKAKFITNVMMFLDKYSCRKSDLIITVGRDLVETVNNRFKGKKIPKTVMINNWSGEKDIYPLDKHPHIDEFKQKYGLDGKFVFMYSGNIGLYYDLENLISVVEKFPKGTKTPDGREVVFAFIGDGIFLKRLKDYVSDHKMKNVVFIPYQDKADLIYSLNSGDVHWVVNAKGIKGVSCPSKYYGVAAAGKPCLAVLEQGSEIRCIIEETNGGLCSEPLDYPSVEKNIQWFIDNADTSKLKTMGMNGRSYLEKNLTADVSIRRYEEEISKL